MAASNASGLYVKRASLNQFAVWEKNGHLILMFCPDRCSKSIITINKVDVAEKMM